MSEKSIDRSIKFQDIILEEEKPRGDVKGKNLGGK